MPAPRSTGRPEAGSPPAPRSARVRPRPWSLFPLVRLAGSRRRPRSPLSRTFTLAGKLREAFAAGGQLGLLDDHDGEAVLDAKAQLTALTDQPVAVHVQTGMAWV